MKKTVKIFIVTMLTMALFAGCSGNKSVEKKETPKKTGVTVEDVQKNIEGMVTASNYITGTREDGTQYYAFKSDLFREYDLKFGVSLDSETRISLPGSYPILLTLGWKFSEEGYKNLMLKPAASTNVKCEKNGKVVTLYLKNTTDQEIKCVNGAVNRIKMELYSKEDKFKEKLASAPDFVIGDKINNDTDMKGIISVIGEPSDISYSVEDGICTAMSVTYQNVSKNDSLSFGLSPDGKKITSVDYSID